MSLRNDYFKGDGTNTVFLTEKEYEGGTVIVEGKIKGGKSFVKRESQELGNKYVMVLSVPEKDEELRITYTIEGTFNPESTTEYNLIKRVKELEGAVKDLHVSNIALKEALNNRINITTFQAWTRLIEKKTGITLIDNNFGHISQELYSDRV